MGQIEQQPAVGLILDGIESRRDDLADEMLSEITAGIGEYQSEGSTELRSDVRAHCGRHVDEIVRSVRSGGMPDPRDLAFAQAAARRRYDQNLSLDAFLRAFRIGLRVIWNAVLEEADDLNERSSAVDLALPMMRYLDTMSSCVAEAYLSTQKLAESVADQADRDLLELLLAGDERARDSRSEQGRLRLGPDQVVLVATLAEEWDPKAFRDLGDELKSIFGSEHALVAPRHDEVVLITDAARVDPAMLSDRLGTSRRASAGVPACRVGVGTPAGGLAAIPEAHRQARAALGLASEESPVVCLSRMPVLEYMVAREDPLVEALIPEAVRELAASQVPMDRILMETLFAYMDSNMNVQRTAAALPAHPNTVHYRLNRLSERTGHDHRDLGQMLELTVALRLAGPTLRLERRGPTD